MALPKFQVYTTDKTSPRSFPWLWFLRLPAIVFTIVVLGITAANDAFFKNSDCSIPSKLGYNIAVSVISFIILVYLLLATGPSPKVRLLPWLIWGQLALDFFLLILWLAASASSSYNCDDLCNACSDYSDLYYDNLYCFCFSNVEKRDYSPVRKGPLMPRTPRVRAHGSSNSDNTSGSDSTAAARKAFDSIMTVIFFICVLADLFWIFQASKSTNTTTSAPAKQGEAGVLPATAGIPLSEQQQGANAGYYGSQPMQQQGGYQQQPTTQSQYSEGQYPTQYPQGQPQQQYPQTQAVPQHQYENPPQSNYNPKDGAPEVVSPIAHEGGHVLAATQ